MIGVIDVGSNSVRLMLLGKDYKSKQVETTGLARGSYDGYLKDDAINRTLSAILRFCNVSKENNVERTYIFATEAVRSSKNGVDFANRVKELTGITVQIIPSEREAEMGFYGAHQKGVSLVLDIGGASTEIVVGNDKEIIYKKSLPIGVVRIKDAVDKGEDITAYIRSIIKGYGEVPTADEYYAIGGTAGTIVAITEKMEKYDPTITHGYKLKKEVVEYWKEKMKNMTVDEIKALKGIDVKRAEIIEGGVNLLLAVMDMLKIDEITVSENDNLEGFVYCYNVKY